MNRASVIVVGAGVGGLSAAALLAAKGLDVQVLERGPQPGGKLRAVELGGRRLDAGPTVLTMRWVFDELFATVGASLADHLRLTPADVLARHAWGPGPRLDLHADLPSTLDAIGRFAGPAEAQRYAVFCRRAARIYAALEQPFLRDDRPSVPALLWRSARHGGWSGLRAMAGISPFARMWPELCRHFQDPRLRQLFGRYATYCGSSPYLAPATLMLVAHVEREGVWLVDGGMQRVATALAGLAQSRGAHLRCDADVAEILAERGRAVGVRLRSGERLMADAVLFNGDVAALASGALGEAAGRGLEAVARAWQRPIQRSLSALTWSAVADTSGFPLLRHNVFFSADYAAEFDDVCRQGRLPSGPTVYVCAQDRGAVDAASSVEPRRAQGLLVLVNAPALADRRPLTALEIDACEQQVFQRLGQAGLSLRPTVPMLRTTPDDFAQRFPGTGGALYGTASHGWRASFTRLGSKHPLPGLYLAGGSTHPGPGVPMAALSGRLAADRLLADLASTRSWHPMAMPGGTSMR